MYSIPIYSNASKHAQRLDIKQMGLLSQNSQSKSYYFIETVKIKLNTV